MCLVWRNGRSGALHTRTAGASRAPADEINALSQTKAPLIRLRGQWVAVDPEQLLRGLEFLKSNPGGQIDLPEILALAAGHVDDAPLEITTVRTDGWLGDLLDGTAAQSLQPLETPPGFAATLRPCQQRGLSWLAFLSALGLGSCLADDMGLGKTVQLLAGGRAAPRRSRDGADTVDLPDVVGRQLAARSGEIRSGPAGLRTSR